MSLLSLALLAAGGVLVYVHTTKRDRDGFYATAPRSLATPTYAFVSNSLRIDTGDQSDWVFRRGRLGTVRVTATGTRAHPIFLGIARKSEVASYVRSVAHDEVTDIDVHPFSVNAIRRDGHRIPASPERQRFWLAKVSGLGRQKLVWPVQNGAWSVVMMNADATRGVRASVSVGAKVPYLLWVGIGLLSIGGPLAAGGCAAIYSGVRARQRTP